ncbi:unnamed protein product, partial [Ascophyllum nodosum]
RVILSQTPSFRRWRLWMETMAYCGSRGGLLEGGSDSASLQNRNPSGCLYLTAQQPERPAVIVLVLQQSRALSLRNLVSGYECGRVFPAGVGP